MDLRPVDVGAYALLVGSALVGILLWPSLPAELAIHFGAGGQPDSYVAKPVGIVLTPAIGVAAVLVTRYAPDWVSRTYHSLRMEDLTVVFVSAVVAYLQGFLYLWNLGFRLSPLFVVAPVLLAAVLLAASASIR